MATVLNNNLITKILLIEIPVSSTYTLAEQQSSKLKNARPIMIVSVNDVDLLFFALKRNNANYSKMYSIQGSVLTVNLSSDSYLSITNRDSVYNRNAYIISI